MFEQTHRSVQNPGAIEGESTYTVYRDKAAKYTLTHTTVRRGGCLYIGEVVMHDLNTGAHFAFTVKQSPWNTERGPKIAESYWTRHADKLA